MSRTLVDGIVDDLEQNLLPFWRERAVDNGSGGFIAEMSAHGDLRTDTPCGLILTSRLLWTYSALFHARGQDIDLILARRALEVLDTRFWDCEHGGYYWLVGGDGRPVDSSKKTYGHAFCVYALSEFHRATGDSEVLSRIAEVQYLIDGHAFDEVHGGYLEARAVDWSPASELRLSNIDQDAPKSMNNHLHLLEAFTNLQRFCPTNAGRTRLRMLLDLFGRHILEPDADGLRLRHFFDVDWRPESDTRTYGHDIEAAWLLGEAAEVLGDSTLRAEVDQWSVGLARSVLATGVDTDGGLAYEGRGQTVVNANRDWWCQAEAVVGFQHVFGLTGNSVFAEASERSWRFIERFVIDRTHGEWHWRVKPDGTVDSTAPKVSAWKGPYHSVRMCLEMKRRLANGSGEAT